ncbi:MAG: NTP transferase domain-containing protein [Leptospiraceae bacterium]|nr:NTP transferase domain-containing protein [Leptospiraceae bacterium]MCP5493062.1 NTP transferase domain-containing protein [Leptospiraceae bacterium]
MSISIAILAGGLATRLHPITQTIPKAMIEICGKPFLEHQIQLFKSQGFTEIVVLTGYLSNMIEEYFGDGSKFGIHIQYSYDGDKLLGTGGALQKALPLLSENFIVIYGDSYLSVPYSPIVEFYLNHTTGTKKQSQPEPLALMTVYKNADLYDKSNVVFQNGILVDYNKKQKRQDMEYIDWGLGIINQSAFSAYQNIEVFDLAELYQSLLPKKQLIGYEVFQRFYEIGSFDGLNEIEKILV